MSWAWRTWACAAVAAVALAACSTEPPRAGEDLCLEMQRDAGGDLDATAAAPSCFRVLGSYSPPESPMVPNPLSISVAWSPDEEYALIGTEGSLRLSRFSRSTSKLFVVTEHAQQDRVFVAWTPDGNHALAASLDLRLYSVTREPPELKELDVYAGHRGNILSVSVSPYGSHVLTGGEDGTVRLLALAPDVDRTLTELSVFDGSHGKVFDVQWSPQGNSAWAATEGGLVWRFDVTDDALVLAHTLDQHREMTVVTPSPRGDRMLTGGWTPCSLVELWNIGNETPVRLDTFTGHPSGIRALTWTQDEQTVFTAGHDDTVFAHALRDNRLQTLGSLEDYPFGVHALSLTRDGRFLLVAASKTDLITLVDVSACTGGAP